MHKANPRHTLLWALTIAASLFLFGCTGQPTNAATAPAATQPLSKAPAQKPSAQAASPAQPASASAAPTAANGPATVGQSASECTPGAPATPAQTEGPYTANPPQRASLLEPGVTGTNLVITGYVLTTDCQPIAGARVDFWQADDKGQYDNTGYRLRGYQLTDAAGRYTLQTIVPGLYSGRTRHIHVKVQAPSQSTLTTQLYFAGEPGNASDRIFDDRLLVNLQESADGKTGIFDFVLSRG